MIDINVTTLSALALVVCSMASESFSWAYAALLTGSIPLPAESFNPDNVLNNL